MAVTTPTIKNVTYQDANGAPTTRQIAEASGTVAAVADAATVVPGSELDVGGLNAFGFTFRSTIFGTQVSMYGANSPDFTDEVLLNTTIIDVLVNTNKGWVGGLTGVLTTGAIAFSYRYVRAKADNIVDASVATLAWWFFGKNS